MAIFRLSETQQEDFAKFPEIYPGAQLGFVIAKDFEGACLIVCDQIAILVDEKLPAELDKFIKMVWRDQDRPAPSVLDRDVAIRRLYMNWMGELAEAEKAFPMEAVSRSHLTGIVTGTLSPPRRPTLVPGAPHGRGTLPSTPAHLPFHTVSKQNEIFYRWEAWPTSRRIHSTGNVDPWTFASPEAELKLIETGFAAVGRAALPSFFPHVFRWKLEPPAGTSMLCGAVVPMYGQAGGGVEVCFDVGVSNVTASQTIIEPL